MTKTHLKSPMNDQNLPEITLKWPKNGLLHPALGMAIRTHCKNDHYTPEIIQKGLLHTWNHPEMTKTHLKSPRNDQNLSGITRKRPKKMYENEEKLPNFRSETYMMLIKVDDHTNMCKNTPKLWNNGQNGQKNAWSLLHWGPPRKPGGPARCARLRATLARGPPGFLGGLR